LALQPHFGPLPAPGKGRVMDFFEPVYRWLGQHYDLIRGLHILAVIAWMAGLLYLPRLFVYHAEAPRGSAMDETFAVMERRL
jgi:putative membrane protein